MGNRPERQDAREVRRLSRRSHRAQSASAPAGHQTEGRISIQTVVGHIQVRAQGRTFDLPAGSLLALDQGIPHDVEALEESAFLLTIAWPGRHEKE
jgi:quercetin dioxygenase-like cupin family protein